MLTETETTTQTGTATLHLVHPMPSHGAGDFVTLFEDLTWLLGKTRYSATAWPTPGDEAPDPDHEERAWELGAGAVIHRVSFASPASVVADVGLGVATAVSTLSMLIFAVKQIWTLPLELKTQREQQRQLFYEAVLRADALEKAVKEGVTAAELDRHTTDGFAAGLEQRAGRSQPATGGEAVLEVRED